MTHMDKKFQEMRKAATESGLPTPTEANLDEMEAIWAELESALQPPDSGQKPMDFGHESGFAKSKHDRQIAPPRNPLKLIWAISTGIAALVVFGFLIFQSVMMRSTIEDMQVHVKNLESSLILASLRSDSAVDRMDGLLKLTSVRDVDPSVMNAVGDRLSLDPNTNVRLASVRALVRHADQPKVLNWLEDAIRSEQSPQVTLEILEVLWNHNAPLAENLWKELQNDTRFEAINQIETTTNLKPSTTYL